MGGIPMKSRDRVINTIERTKIDRTPLDGWFRPETMANLRQYFKTDQNEEVLKALGIDFREIRMDPPEGFEPLNVLPAQKLSKDFESFYATMFDEWGIKRVAGSTSEYWHFTYHPLEHLEIDDYVFPDLEAPRRFDRAEKLANQYSSEYFVVGNATLGLFEGAWALRGYRTFIRDLYTNEQFVTKLLDRLLKWKIEQCKRLIECGADVVFTSDDLGIQTGLMLSPDIIRKYFIPRYRTWFSELKKNGAYIIFHTDGKVEPIIPDLINAGIDILNPVQPECMDPAAIMEKYGDKIAIHGTISVQKTLPFGTIDEVKKEVETRIITAGRNGGLIIAPTHTVDKHVPIDNIVAMYSTARQTKLPT
jgi:uroporphyrinogen decarboxylase